MSQGSKTDTAVKLVLIFFISLLSFSVGTFVGKQVSDADHRRASLEVETDTMENTEREIASVEAEPDDGAISDEEVASLTREFMEAEKTMESESASLEEAVAQLENEADEAPAKDKVEKAATRVADNKAPAKDKPMARKPASTLPVAVAASSVGKYTVQIGSYPTEQEAKAYASEMKEKGYSAFYVPADVKGKTWYRVSIGLYGDTKSANDYKNKLITDKVIKSAIVSKIVK